MGESEKVNTELSKEDLEKSLYERLQDIPKIMNMFHAIRDLQKEKKTE
jgi:hypothetical protein